MRESFNSSNSRKNNRQVKFVEEPFMKTSPEELLTKAITLAINNQYGIAAFRLPEKKATYMLLGRKPEKRTIEDLEKLPPTFLVAPFKNSGQAYFIPCELILEIEENQIRPLKMDEALKKELELTEGDINLPEFYPHPHIADFKRIVKKSVETIAEKRLKKVVIARNKFLPSEISPTNFFFKLNDTFPAAFVSLTFLPETGLWLGASPELLVSRDEYGHFHTVALAATQILEHGKTPEEAVWTQKEIEEQALVSRYIVECFKSIRLRSYDEEGPVTTKTGNLLHLKTFFKVDTFRAGFPDLSSRMLRLLHPTSAVGGMPREEALQFIHHQEKLNRELYTGFSGPVNIFNSIDLFVNLRCGKIYKNGILLFAGAGLTDRSRPDKEFLETELKMDVLAELIG